MDKVERKKRERLRARFDGLTVTIERDGQPFLKWQLGEMVGAPSQFITILQAVIEAYEDPKGLIDRLKSMGVVV